MNGRVASRFEIGHHREGLVATHAKLDAAKQKAVEWARSSGYPNAIREVRVFDVMAKVGAYQTYATNGTAWYPIRVRTK